MRPTAPAPSATLVEEEPVCASSAPSGEGEELGAAGAALGVAVGGVPPGLVGRGLGLALVGAEGEAEGGVAPGTDGVAVGGVLGLGVGLALVGAVGEADGIALTAGAGAALDPPCAAKAGP